MTRTRCQSSLVLILAFLVSSAVAQVATGTPPFSSLEGGPDIVNLGNLNVHMAYPVLHKAGRGLPLSFDLTNDSSFWYPATSGSSTVWEPVTTGGWSGSPQGVGNILYLCATDGYSYISCSYFTYYDSAGTAHPFNGTAAWYNCAYWDPCGDSPLVDSITTDSSGYTLNADACYVEGNECYLVISETSADGSSIVPQNGIPLNPTVTPGSVIDRNGNEITTDQYGSVTDTLGLQNGLQTLRVSGGVPNPYVLAYTSPAGTTANVTSTPKSYQVRTNFGCAGIGEYGGTGGLTASLVNTITLPDGTFYQFTYETTPGDTHSPHNVTGRVASITLPTGGTISYNYTGTNNGIECKDGSTSGLTRTTPDGTWTYTRTLGTGAASTTTVEDPKGNYTVIQFQGIYETQRQTYQGAIAAANLLQTINTCYNGAAAPCTATAIVLPVLSRTVTTQLGTATSSVQSKKIYTYTVYGLTKEEDDYDWGPTAPGALLKKTIITLNTSLGAIENLPASVTIENGSGATVASAVLTYDGAALTATTGTPQHVTFTGPRGNLTTLAVTANTSTTLYRQFTYYDTGNPNGSTAVSTSSTTPGAATTYNYAAGTASCGNSFATSVSEPLSLSHSMTWNCVGGVELTATDENGAVTSSTYTDPYFWRPSETTDALLNNTLLTYAGANIAESALNFNGTVSTVDLRITTDGLGRPELAQKKQSQTATKYDTTESVYDVAGLLKHTTLPFSAAAGGTNPTAPGPTTTYDGLNRPLQVSDSGGGTVTYSYSKNDVLVTSGPAPSGENTKRRQMEYDGLGRLLSVCELTTATGNGTCGQNTTQTGYWTKYTYDANGNQTGVTQNAQAAAASQQTRTYIYDQVSRLTSETNPESGTKTYTYDSDATCGSSTSQAGQLVKRVDAMSNITCYAYDALNRNTSITYPSGSYAASTPSKTFVYDATTFTCPNPSGAFVKGRLAEAYTGPSTAKVTDIAYCYSARGETTDVFESTPASGGYYHTTASYWANGATETLSGVPGLSSWAFAPDGEGRPYSATYGTSTWVSGATYYPSNSSNPPTNTVAFGNGDTDVYSLDANTWRVNQFQFTAGATPQSLTGVPGWNANGTLGTLGITDQFNASNVQNCSYVHDDLARIQSVNCVNGSTGVWNQSFIPTDPFGNVSKSGSSSYVATYLLSNGSTNNQEQTVGSCVPTFDANGNLTKDCSNSNVYSWDADGNLISINANPFCLPSTACIGITYDALDREVQTAYTPPPPQPGVARGQESCPGSLKDTCTEFLYSPIGKLGRMNVQTPLSMRFPLPGGSTAELIGATGATENTLHADWLGSARLSTSYVNRTLTYDLAYAPFGEAYAASGTYTAGDLNFTGQSSDTIAGNGLYASQYGLYDFLYRKYSAVHSRWLSPDPGGLGAVNPNDPQTWNRYAYVRNSPLNRVDPLGLDEGGCDPDDPDCGGDGGGGCDWGCDGGGGGGTINMDWGPRGVNVGFTGFGGCSGESLGMPCGLSLPGPSQFARQAIIAAMTHNWKALIGLGLAPLEQDLWNQALNPIYDFEATGLPGRPDLMFTFFPDLFLVWLDDPGPPRLRRGKPSPAPTASVSAYSPPSAPATPYFEILQDCIMATELSMGRGVGAVPDVADRADEGQMGTQNFNNWQAYNPLGNSQGTAAGNAAAFIGGTATCMGGASNL